MARLADVSKLPSKSRAPRRPIKNRSPKIKSRKKMAKLPLFNTFLILGIYAILLKEYWLPLLIK